MGRPLPLKFMLAAAALIGTAGAQSPAQVPAPHAPTAPHAPAAPQAPTPAQAPTAPNKSFVAQGPLPANVHRLSHGRFNDVWVYVPPGSPTSFALFISGEQGPNPTTDAMAQQLARQGAMVAVIDWSKLKANLEADDAQCVFPDGDLENLSHFVQAYFHTATYLSPILLGTGEGAAMAYGVLAQAPRDTFAAALTVDFCPAFNLQKPLCKGSGFEFTRPARGRGLDVLPIRSLANPWVDLQEATASCPAGAAQEFVSRVRGAAIVNLPPPTAHVTAQPDWMPQFMAAYARLALENPTRRAAPPPPGLSDLPIIEIPAQSGALRSAAAPGDSFAVILSGDGGWAGLDQDVAGALSAKGIPVVGLDSLRYFWSARTPDGLAADVDRIIRYYLAHFHKGRALLIGYSQGADVLPFALNRLPAATRAQVALAVVMGLSEHALFEFHLSSWVSDSNAGPATLPEIEHISGVPVLCIYGEEESDTLCPKLDPTRFSIVKLKGGHHFDGDYAGLAQKILTAAGR
jgi:type IV secretory pathway VirJ component